MKNVAVFFGGKTVEHDISIITGMQVIKNLNLFKYNVIPVYIGKDNTFYTDESLKNANTFTNLNVNKLKKVCLVAPSDNLFLIKKNKIKPFIKLDFAIITGHGGIGENGELSGLCEMCNIPCSAGNIFALTSAMDKEKTKILLKGLGLPFVEYLSITKENFENYTLNLSEGTQSKNQENSYGTNIAQDILNQLGYPVIVKPANLGSSIGIKQAHNFEEFLEAAKFAFTFDNVILVEKFLSEMKELNCSAMQVGKEVLVSEIEEPIKLDEFLTFDNKYLESNSVKNTSKVSSHGMQTLKRKFPAELPIEIKEKVQNATKIIYEKLSFIGVIRIDYFYDINGNEIFVNEINSIPGSMAFYLWDGKFSFSSLLDEIIKAGEQSFNLSQKKQTFFESSVLNGFVSGKTNSKIK